MLPASELTASLSPSELDFAAIFPSAQPVGQAAGFALYRAGELLLGQQSRPVAADLRGQSEQMYRQLFTAAAGWQLYRVWNQVPEINGTGPSGLENYRAFSAGRSLAFEQHFGRAFAGQLPAASGVGTRATDLTVAFVAGRGVPRHFENPAQVPAYQYPSEHGPRPPSFARATVGEANRKALVFISGTAAIKGHRTISPFVLPGQLEVTLDNLALIGAAAGIGADLGASGAWKRYFKVYYRSAADREFIGQILGTSLLRPGDDVVWREADLCRADLRVEIEATLVAA